MFNREERCIHEPTKLNSLGYWHYDIWDINDIFKIRLFYGLVVVFLRNKGKGMWLMLYSNYHDDQEKNFPSTVCEADIKGLNSLLRLRLALDLLSL